MTDYPFVAVRRQHGPLEVLVASHFRLSLQCISRKPLRFFRCYLLLGRAWPGTRISYSNYAYIESYLFFFDNMEIENAIKIYGKAYGLVADWRRGLVAHRYVHALYFCRAVGFRDVGENVYLLWFSCLFQSNL